MKAVPGCESTVLKHVAIVSVAFLVFAAGAAAQSLPSDVPVNPGFIKADSPLHGVERTVDNMALAAGMASRSDIAHERASEAAVALQRNNTDAAQEALNATNRIARTAAGNTTGLQKAEQVLNAVQEQAPGQAQSGIEEALGNVQAAQKRNASVIGEPGGAIPDPRGGQPEDTGSGNAPGR